MIRVVLPQHLRTLARELPGEARGQRLGPLALLHLRPRPDLFGLVVRDRLVAVWAPLPGDVNVGLG